MVDRFDLGSCSKPIWRFWMPGEAIQCKPLEVVVSDRGIERAIKMLKRKLASEGYCVNSRCGVIT